MAICSHTRSIQCYNIQKKFLTGRKNEDFEKFEPYVKPYTKNVVLEFELDNLKFIIVNKKQQKNIIYQLLFKRFGKDTVMDKIVKGEIDILSRDMIWNNL